MAFYLAIYVVIMRNHKASCNFVGFIPKILDPIYNLKLISCSKCFKLRTSKAGFVLRMPKTLIIN